MIQEIQYLVKKMSQELPHLLAAGVVSLEDGFPLAEAENNVGIDTAAVSAYLTSVVKSNSNGIHLLGENHISDDILITTDQCHIIVRHGQGSPFFIFLVTGKEVWLAKARLLIKRYEPEFLKRREAFAQEEQ